MKSKALIQRTLALGDTEQAIAHYLEQDAPTAALGFVDALERAYAHIGKHPATGSPRYAHELGIPELRSWSLHKYPYLVFYVEHEDHIDVWRVLHMKRDIPAWMVDGADNH
ncbi:type II toxin-antitoxin system RelE/ParE family toxin [Rhodoferax sp. AJA081-3]|uniref:type II toxin-antitoxin system RelE/ParE family toxin n=1 Tax=Rhodoferax sp. AJA081-3 TaxID=2752316 RepID=UPI001AE0B6A5|nr:type II toxin-antitoxin system RelE/ParE family toxin [Rhodoferax sp. AJA081-3]QTN26452.1 type II toxin-antitoxin system RelE/ParE family toxin [Rhodoferax sp. AJA081-3]